MRRLISLLIWIAALYSGYWFAVAQTLQFGSDKAVEALAETGVDLRFGSVTTTGYPSRFETTVTDLNVGHADWSWQGAQVVFYADSYRPLSITLRLSRDQLLAVAGQNLRISSEEFRSDLSLQPTPQLAFDKGQVILGATRLASDAGWQLDLGALTARLAQSNEGAAVYDADLTAKDLILPAILRDQIDPDAVLGADLRQIIGAAQLTLSDPLDRHLQGRPPSLDHIILHDLQIDWGPLTVALAGAVAFDADGIPEGQITLRTTEWQIVLDILTRAGLINAVATNSVTLLARFMADADGVLSLPFTFQDGITLLGPVPVGPAPRLR